MHVGEAMVATLESIPEPCVLDSLQVQDRGVEVVDMNGVLGGVMRVIVDSSESLAVLHARAGNQRRRVSVKTVAGWVLPSARLNHSSVMLSWSLMVRRIAPPM